MYEKVNPAHPDKVADRIAGAIVDLAYLKETDPRIAVEVLIGHGVCHVIIETTTDLEMDTIHAAIHRIVGRNVQSNVVIVPQDAHLAANQKHGLHCGDNGIFKGVPLTFEQRCLSAIAHTLYGEYQSDGKYILNGDHLIICQSNADTNEIRERYPSAVINPLGDWTGGTDVDTGATNRKLGSDMGDSITGGGLHGKDLSKADYWLAEREGRTLERLNELYAVTDQVGFKMTERLDGRLILPEAVKVLQMKTST